MIIRKISLALLLCLLLASHASAESQFKPFVSGSLAEIEQHYADQAFILSFWSIDCPPCIKELALIQQTLVNHTDMNIVLISTDQINSSAQAFKILEQFSLTEVDNWMFADDFVERLRYEVDPNWTGSIPQAYFYLPRQPRQGVAGALDEKHITGWLAQSNKHH